MNTPSRSLDSVLLSSLTSRLLIGALIAVVPLACSGYDPQLAGGAGEETAGSESTSEMTDSPATGIEEVDEQGTELGLCGFHTPNKKFTQFTFTGTNHGFRFDGLYQAGTNLRTFSIDRESTEFGGRLPFFATTAEATAIDSPSPQGFTYVDFVSPQPFNWEGFERYRFEIRNLVPASASSPLFAQLRLVSEKCNGAVSHFVDVDADGRPVFCPIDAVGTFTCTADLGADWDRNVREIKEARVRVFFPQVFMGETTVALDNLRPIF